MPKSDPHIISKNVLSAPCKTCRRRTDSMFGAGYYVGDAHFVDREFYCEECCPKCKTKTESHA